MGLESSFNFIDDLEATNPAAGDNISEGDDHIRGIKNAVKGSFTSLGNAAVTKTAAEINDLVDKSTAQTITGLKTFQANLKLDTAAAARVVDFNTGAISVQIQGLTTGDVRLFDDTNTRQIYAYDESADTFTVRNLVSTGATLTTPTLTSPVINTGISGTALETTITDTDTKVPTSGAVFDKVGGLNTAAFDIGDWNMDTTFSTSISLGGIAYTKIRSLKATIRNNTDAQYYDFATHDNGESLYAQTGFIFLSRTTGGFFDSTDFDSTTYNRGWVVVQYID